tara:strand:+ start:432 stop:941 length:510 start_codon:yes stop_codon:yes gene_type:complete
VKKNLVLIGMMAVGKTTLGKIVAKQQDLEFIDSDRWIEKKNNMSINEIFEKKGEKFFRSEERKEIQGFLKKRGYVIALGGGAFINNAIRENVLKNSISIWLDINTKTLYERTLWNQKRPLLKNGNIKKRINEIYLERKKIYKLANHKIICDGLNKKDIVKKILKIYEKY